MILQTGAKSPPVTFIMGEYDISYGVVVLFLIGTGMLAVNNYRSAA